MAETSRAFYRHVSPVLIVGAIALSTVSTVAALRYTHTEANATTKQPTEDTVDAAQPIQPSGSSDQHSTIPSDHTDDATSSDATSESSNNGTTSTGSVTVNGQTYRVEGNGTINKTITDNNGQTSVNISVQSSGNAQNSSSSSSSVHVHSQSVNSSNVQSNVRISP